MTRVFTDSGRLTDASKLAFVEALKLSAGERAAFLETQISDPSARLEVMRLLEWYREDFLDTSLVPPSMLDSLAGEFTGEGAGRHFGEYVTIRELGRGGMGVVYLARRADSLHDRPIAIKCLQAGAGREELLSRLRREMRILASLHHPFIVSFVDAGLCQNGIYLAMEYVEGRSLDAFCAERALGQRDRLRLFLKICTAVSHAHRALVVHRDLKPANILVSDDGTPKLLDFGVAKVLNESECEPLTTAAGWRATLRYASPEQVLPDAPLSTSSDVYSLGVILYELLTGQSPYGSTTDPVPLLDALLNRDPIDPRSVAPKLPPDLQHILMKCLRKDPDGRYESVDDLRQDVSNFLHDKPVAARNGASWYVLSKFLRRRWQVVLAVTAVMAAVVGGAAVSYAYARESQERLLHFIAITQRLLDVMGKEQTHELTTQALVETGQQLLVVTAGFKGGDESLGPLAEALLALGNEEAHPTAQNVGATGSAVGILEQAWRIAALLHARRPGDRAAANRFAAASFSLGTVLIEENRYADALPYFQRMAEWAKRENRPDDYGEALANLSRIALHDNDEARCLDLRRQAVAIRRGLAGKGNPRFDQAFAGTVASYGYGLRHFGHYPEALDAYAESDRILDGLPSALRDGVQTASIRARNREQVGRTLLAMGRNREARDAFLGALALFEQMEARAPWSAGNRRSMASTLGVLATAQDATGDRRGARKSAQRAIKLIDAAAAADTANQKVKEEAAEIHRRADALHAH